MPALVPPSPDWQAIYNDTRPTFNPDHVTMSDYPYGEVPKVFSDRILDDITYGSSFMQLAEEVQMSAPIESYIKMSGVEAFVVDEAAPIPTSTPDFTPRQMVARKLGVIIPSTKELLKFTMSNFFERVRPRIAEAFYRKADNLAFLSGKDLFGYSLMDSATAAGHVTPETDNKYDDISNAMALLEANDYIANGVASTNKQRNKYRMTKDNDGYPLFMPATEKEPARVAGTPVAFLHNKAFQDDTIAEVVGDWRYAKYAILSGMEYELSTQASITTLDPSDGEVPISAFQRELVFLKATMWFGFMIEEDEAFAVITRGGNTDPQSAPVGEAAAGKATARSKSAE